MYCRTVQKRGAWPVHTLLISKSVPSSCIMRCILIDSTLGIGRFWAATFIPRDAGRGLCGYSLLEWRDPCRDSETSVVVAGVTVTGASGSTGRTVWASRDHHRTRRPSMHDLKFLLSFCPSAPRSPASQAHHAERRCGQLPPHPCLHGPMLLYHNVLYCQIFFPTKSAPFGRSPEKNER